MKEKRLMGECPTKYQDAGCKEKGEIWMGNNEYEMKPCIRSKEEMK
jgi:hypothetical protein